MEHLRLGWSSIVIVATLAFACSHEEEGAEPRAARTSGGESREDDRRDERADPARTAESEEARAEDADAPTAFDQSNDETDLAITQAVRVAVVEDDSLSLTAQNCTIVTVDAVVTLRGDVDTTAESAAIERHARAVDGVRRVDNLLRVQP